MMAHPYMDNGEALAKFVRDHPPTPPKDTPMNGPKANQIRNIDSEHRVAALAQVTQMHDDLVNANIVIAQLRVDLGREQDRVTLMVEERDRYRHESIKLRKLLVELATQMANIGILTRKAEECVIVINELDSSPTPDTAAIDRLQASQDMEKIALKNLGAALDLKMPK
jgi:hypothetical protein